MDNIESFVSKIPDFDSINKGLQINYFCYYCLTEMKLENVGVSDIQGIYKSLNLIPYSNIPLYLNNHSKNKDAIFIKSNDGKYVLTRQERQRIEKEVNNNVEVPITNNLLDLSILEHAPYYIKHNAKEMGQCYDSKLYNATLVLMRKIFETLIIECYEKHGVDAEIKDKNGVFLFLSDLIDAFCSCTKWNASRNFSKNIKEIKKIGDASAHNRRFLATKKDIDDIKYSLRQCVQEIILIIDYNN